MELTPIKPEHLSTPPPQRRKRSFKNQSGLGRVCSPKAGQTIPVFVFVLLRSATDHSLLGSMPWEVSHRCTQHNLCYGQDLLLTVANSPNMQLPLFSFLLSLPFPYCPILWLKCVKLRRLLIAFFIITIDSFRLAQLWVCLLTNRHPESSSTRAENQTGGEDGTFRTESLSHGLILWKMPFKHKVALIPHVTSLFFKKQQCFNLAKNKTIVCFQG